jgi:hypothetical protein
MKFRGSFRPVPGQDKINRALASTPAARSWIAALMRRIVIATFLACLVAAAPLPALPGAGASGACDPAPAAR